jgi:hypothetical protein
LVVELFPGRIGNEDAVKIALVEHLVGEGDEHFHGMNPDLNAVYFDQELWRYHDDFTSIQRRRPNAD